jgi:hypothetical protein
MEMKGFWTKGLRSRGVCVSLGAEIKKKRESGEPSM